MSEYKPSRKHAELGPEFYDEVRAANFPQHILRHRNQRWAARVGLEELTDERWVDHFGRFVPLAGTYETPLALRYHGHQFQTYNPDIGDGRGFLYAQLYDDTGRLLDLATKGSGRTPYSRGADGRLTLKGGVRELLATEMLEALGVNTSKTFSLIETGEELHRHDEPSPTRSGVLVRLSHSHIRIGTLQRLLALGDTAGTRKLVDYAIANYITEASDPPSFLKAVARRVARTGARWAAAGFVHGVLNTDNINITGESFDYGPWRFVPTYDPSFVAAYFDQSGLYAFGRQPDVLAWNLTRLAECLLPLGDKDELERALNTFWTAFSDEMRAAVLDRLGLKPLGEFADSALVTSFFTFLHETQAPYEQTFFDWRGGVPRANRPQYRTLAFENLRKTIADHVPAAGANLNHHYFGRENPRTMLIEDMESLWTPIAQRDDWGPLTRVLEDLAVVRDAYGVDRARD